MIRAWALDEADAARTVDGCAAWLERVACGDVADGAVSLFVTTHNSAKKKLSLANT